MADAGVLAVAAGIAGGAVSYLGARLELTKVRQQLDAQQGESFGQYKQGLRAAYREFLVAVEGLEQDADGGKIPADEIERLRDMYYRAYFGGNEAVEAALEAFWPEQARRQRGLPVADKRKDLAQAMAKHASP